MTVAELIKELQRQDPNLPVLMPKDDECEEFAAVRTAGPLWSRCGGDHVAGYAEETADLINNGFTAKEIKEYDGCVVVWW